MNYIAALLVLNSESKSSDEDIQRYIDEVNKDLTQPEKIKKFIFIDEPFSIENNLMTPTMKVRRHEVQKKYQNQIDQLFFTFFLTNLSNIRLIIFSLKLNLIFLNFFVPSWIVLLNKFCLKLD